MWCVLDVVGEEHDIENDGHVAAVGIRWYVKGAGEFRDGVPGVRNEAEEPCFLLFLSRRWSNPTGINDRFRNFPCARTVDA